MLAVDAPKAACRDALDLVDLAYDRPGGTAGKTLTEVYCSHCPLADACLMLGMSRHELGVWGGVGTHRRTRHRRAKLHQAT